MGPFSYMRVMQVRSDSPFMSAGASWTKNSGRPSVNPWLNVMKNARAVAGSGTNSRVASVGSMSVLCFCECLIYFLGSKKGGVLEESG